MKKRLGFFLRIVIVFIAAAVMLAGCSSNEIIDAPAAEDTVESVQPENSSEEEDTAEETEADTSETTASTTEATTADSEATTPEPTEATTPEPAVIAVTEPTEAETTKPVATTTTTKPVTTTTTAKPVTTTTTTEPVTTTTTAKPATTPAETTATAQTTTTAGPLPQSLDPNEIYSILISFKSKYPEGTPWGDDKAYVTNKLFFNTIYTGRACAAFAFELSDAAFGDHYVTEHHDISAIRAGDILRLDNSHTVIVLEVRPNSIVIAEGNYNSVVHWERHITFAELERSLNYIWTRYP